MKKSTEGNSSITKVYLHCHTHFEVTLSLRAVCKQLLFDLDAELTVTMFSTQSEPYLLQQQLLSTPYLEVEKKLWEKNTLINCTGVWL